MADKKAYPKHYAVQPSAQTLRNKLRQVASRKGLGSDALAWYCHDIVKMNYYSQGVPLLEMHIKTIEEFTPAQIAIIKDAYDGAI